MKINLLTNAAILLISTGSAWASDLSYQLLEYQESGHHYIDVSTGEQRLFQFLPGTLKSNITFTSKFGSTSIPGHQYLGHYLYDFYVDTDASGFQNGEAWVDIILGRWYIPYWENQITEVTLSFTGVLDFDLTNSAGLIFSAYREARAQLFGIDDYAYIKYSVDNGDPNNAWTFIDGGSEENGNSDYWRLPAGWDQSDTVWVPNQGSNEVTYKITFGLLHVAAVPEPSHYAMLGLGLGVLGFTYRARSKLG